MKKKILYIDMDNVLVDFKSALDIQSKEILDEYSGREDEIPNLFSQMQPMKNAIESFNMLSKLYDTYILSTAPWNNSTAWHDKLEWVKKHLGDSAYKRLIISHHKNLNKGDYLIDDRTKNGAENFEGELILFGSEEFADWDKVVDYLQKKKIENAIWGFVIGDCLGVPYEFKQKGTFKYQPMHGYGTHNQPPMTWSDDTSLMLSLIDSYENEKFDIEKHKDNLQELLKGCYCVDNILFDIGNGTLKAIQQNFNIDNSNSLGNGGLLRCWIAGIMADEKISELISLTHSNGELYMQCCLFYITLLNNVLQHGKDNGTKKWLHENETAFKTLIKANERLSKTEGCIVETVNIVISSYLKGKTVKNVVELGGDTDSNAALFCALKGAEEDKSILKYKNQIRNSEQIDYCIKQLTNSTEDNL